MFEKLANLNVAEKRMPADNHASLKASYAEESDESDVKRRSSRRGAAKAAKRKLEEDSEDEYKISEGDLGSDLDYEENVPL